jgi:hypothetical protein
MFSWVRDYIHEIGLNDVLELREPLGADQHDSFPVSSNDDT